MEHMPALAFLGAQKRKDVVLKDQSALVDLSKPNDQDVDGVEKAKETLVDPLLKIGHLANSGTLAACAIWQDVVERV